MKFTKYHALGNDYIVVDPNDCQGELTAHEIKIICDRHYGIGSDGILFGPLPSDHCEFKLKIFNPDTSEAEKSGNGLRIFSRYLWDRGLVEAKPFSIETLGGKVMSTVDASGSRVSVEMGQVRFSHGAEGNPPITPDTLEVKGITFEFYRANVGNPHCVIVVEDLSPTLATTYGQAIECDPRFANRTNVQFMKIIDSNTVQIEIWERGAGYTLASGSSSTASAGVAHALGLCEAEIAVSMPGGIIEIAIDPHFYATMTGPVCKIADGTMAIEALAAGSGTTAQSQETP